MDELSPPWTESAVSSPTRATRARLIRRPRLITRLSGDPDCPIGAITAPSGYGKTTLLSQWDEDDERPFIWVGLDHRHDEPTMLIGTIAAALDAVEPLGDRVFAPLMAPRPNLGSVVVPRLCEALAGERRPFVLVLDDLHRVRDRAALEPLATIAEQIPDGSRLVISSREDPAIPLGRLRTRRGVIDLGPADLAMTHAEASAQLGALDLNLSSDNIERLCERTEGWPAGLYLAALTLEGREDAARAVESFCGDDRVVVEYLREEFLSNLSSDDRSFLTQTSVLDRLSGPACDALLEHAGSHETLKRLARANLLLVPLDRRDTEYRYHHLLQEMLVSELHAEGEDQEALLHARASAWYAEHGDADRAISHAIAAGDRELAANLIWAKTPSYESGGRHATLRRWLDEYSEDEIAASPQLCLTLAAGRVTDGDGAGAEHWIGVALQALKAGGGPEADGLALAARAIRATAAAREGVVQMRKDVEEPYALLPEDSPWRSLCALVEGVSWHLVGDRERGRLKLDEGARRGTSSAPTVGLACLSQLALLAIEEGDLREADQLAQRMIEEAELYGLVDHPTTALTYAVNALIRANAGSASDAVRDLGIATQLLSRLNDFSPWYEAEVRIVLARTLVLIDDVAGARTRLADAGRFIQRCPDALVLRNWIAAAWEDVDRAQSVTGRWPLSPAELRVLHQLPTHLSFHEIADGLFVSPNTIRTQARSIYAKLGVSTRSEAVACARTVGLLPVAEQPAVPRATE